MLCKGPCVNSSTSTARGRGRNKPSASLSESWSTNSSAPSSETKTSVRSEEKKEETLSSGPKIASARVSAFSCAPRSASASKVRAGADSRRIEAKLRSRLQDTAYPARAPITRSSTPYSVPAPRSTRTTPLRSSASSQLAFSAGTSSPASIPRPVTRMTPRQASAWDKAKRAFALRPWEKTISQSRSAPGGGAAANAPVETKRAGCPQNRVATSAR